MNDSPARIAPSETAIGPPSRAESREFIAEKARLRPEDLGLVRTARRSHNQLGLAYQIAFIRLTGRAPASNLSRSSRTSWVMSRAKRKA